MSVYSLRKLIDLAIGSPEPGHVNFYALRCVLNAFADRLEMGDEAIVCSIYEGDATTENSLPIKVKEVVVRSTQSARMLGGADASEIAVVEEPASGVVQITEIAVQEEAAALTDPETTNNTESAAADATAAQADPIEPQERAFIKQESKTEIGEQKAPVKEPAQSAEIANATEEAIILPEIRNQESVEQTTKIDFDLPTSKSDEAVVKVVKNSLRDLRTAITLMEKRLSQLEKNISATANATDFTQGVSIMKDQLDLVMGQLHMLTTVVTKSKLTPKILNQLDTISNELNNFRKENVFITSSNAIKKFDDNLLGLLESEADDLAGCEVASHRSSITPEEQEPDNNLDLDMHFTYSSDKILNEMVSIKANVCNLTNKVDSLMAKMSNHDSMQIKNTVENLKLSVQEFKVAMHTMKESQVHINYMQQQVNLQIVEIQSHIQKLYAFKVDKDDLEVLLAQKVDLVQLQKKVSQEQLHELKCRLEKQFCEVRKLIGNHTENIMQTIDHVRNAVGPKAVEEIIKKHKEKLLEDIKTLRDILENYITATTDDCLAAGARIKVLQDLACLSCDTTCNMKIIEKAKVPKLPSAHASNMLAPLITYELGSIRKSGIMGYYRKDEFPHSVNAWQQRHTVAMKSCVPRHAGGEHTLNTAKDRVEKIYMQKK